LRLSEVISRSRIRWHGAKRGSPDWGDQSRSVALTIENAEAWRHLIFNAYWEPIQFELPELPLGFKRWMRVIDTDLASPNDIGSGVEVTNANVYFVQPRSSVVLVASR
jgi:glycogen operon protein